MAIFMTRLQRNAIVKTAIFVYTIRVGENRDVDLRRAVTVTAKAFQSFKEN